VKGSLAVTDNLEFFGKFVVGRLKFTFFDPKITLVLDHYESVLQSPPVPGNGQDEEEWEYVGTTFFEWLNHPMMGKGEWGTFYGGGIKFIWLRRPNFKVGLDAQYLCQEADCQVDLTEATSGDMVSSEEDILQETLTNTGTTEWQVAVVVSGTMGSLSPYGGVKCSIRLRTQENGGPLTNARTVRTSLVP